MTGPAPLRLGPVEADPLFLLGFALLHYLDRDGTTALVLLSALLHELGHLGAIYALGGRVVRLRLSLTGAELRLSARHSLPPGRLLLAALAGPVVNLLLALGSILLARRGVEPRLYLLAGLNLGLACFNLLPCSWLDGGRILACLHALLGLEALGERAAALLDGICALLLLAGGAVLLWVSGGQALTPVLAGLWMLRSKSRSCHFFRRRVQ